jgi:hypothetical protein
LESFLKGKGKGNVHKDNVGSKIQRNVRVRNRYLVFTLVWLLRRKSLVSVDAEKDSTRVTEKTN